MYIYHALINTLHDWCMQITWFSLVYRGIQYFYLVANIQKVHYENYVDRPEADDEK